MEYSICVSEAGVDTMALVPRSLVVRFLRPHPDSQHIRCYIDFRCRSPPNYPAFERFTRSLCQCKGVTPHPSIRSLETVIHPRWNGTPSPVGMRDA
jgi:hypothetical protein